MKIQLSILILFLLFKNGFSQDSIVKNEDFTKIRISANAGMSFMYEKSSQNIYFFFLNYEEEIKSGFINDFGFDFFISQNVAIGININSFNSTSKAFGEIFVFQDSSTFYTDCSEVFKINYFAPTITRRFFDKNGKNQYFLKLGVGKFFVDNNFKYGANDVSNKGNNFGVDLGGGIDIIISKHFSLGFLVTSNFGFISEYEKYIFEDYYETIQLKESENLSRINFAIGLRYNN